MTCQGIGCDVKILGHPSESRCGAVQLDIGHSFSVEISFA